MSKEQPRPLSDQLVRLGWRPVPPEMYAPGQWGRLISAIVCYQAKHGGQSPSDLHLSKEVRGMSPAQVGHALREMEAKGLITDTKGWPRRIIVWASTKEVRDHEPLPLLKAAKTEEEMQPHENTDLPPQQPAKRKRGVGLLDNAKLIAQAITDYYDQHGKAPRQREIAAQLGYSTPNSSSGLSRPIMQMVERGWLHHKPHHRDYMLTALGRAILFGEVREEVHTDMPVRPANSNGHQPQAPVPVNVEVRRAQEPEPMVAKDSRVQMPDGGWLDPQSRVRFVPQATLNTGDPEIDAMRTISVAMEGLDKQARYRVLMWVRDRLSI